MTEKLRNRPRAIGTVDNAGELYRVTDDGHVRRSDFTIVMTVSPLSFLEANTLIGRISGPFSTAREAEERVVSELRAWNDRSRDEYWN